MARPVGKWFSQVSTNSLHKRAFRLCRSRSGPHKGDGIEVPFSAVGLQNADRLSGHLPQPPADISAGC
jgi:hypothetical protein